jgi:hypothetical protein
MLDILRKGLRPSLCTIDVRRFPMSTTRLDLQNWMRLVRAEFDEVPGLSLTQRQAQRLWHLDDASCDALLERMVAARYLRRTTRGLYVRADASPNASA